MAVVAEFIANHVLGLVPLGVQFTDLSTGAPDTWYWTFGTQTEYAWADTADTVWADTADTVWADYTYAAASGDQNPYWIFEAIGTYTVTLTASLGGDEDTETKTDYIVVIANTIARPAIPNYETTESYFSDFWINSKHWYVTQDKPHWCKLMFIDLYCNATNE